MNRPRNNPIKPTESEWEILRILWENGPSTVRQVHEILGLNKSSGYTTTLKLMQIMHEKEILFRDTSNRT
ncbi:MAG: BlaI/MecI/CopY family transcriptional regulator, partial [Chitinophagaceae bacterium]